MQWSRKVLLTCAGLYLFSQIFFLINIQFPRGPNFDEFHYIPSAKQFLELKSNQNSEHPPLGKEIMAVGIGLWGDRPIGWRFMSTVFGALTLVGMYLWGLALFRSEKLALWAALLTLINQLLYVQARIGMLDTFMFCFIVWGMAAFTATWDTSTKDLKQKRRYLLFAGICFGLATCTKWFAVIPWFLCIGWVCAVRMIQHWEMNFKKSQEDDWFHPKLWEGLTLKDWLIYLGVAPLVTYYVPFLVYLLCDNPDYTFLNIFWDMQYKAWDAQGRVVNSHPYMSTWTQWATIRRPIWYAFDKEGSRNELVRGVILLGNPWVLWTGLAALGVCAWSWIVERKRAAFLILTTWCALYFSWAFIPRKIAFFYYYYPAGMVLSFAVAHALNYRWFERLTNFLVIFSLYSIFASLLILLASPDAGPQFHDINPFSVLFFGVGLSIAGALTYQLRETRFSRWIYLGAALCMFLYFFPISAALQIPAESFRKWMWFPFWI